jgi:hypothetical protein
MANGVRSQNPKVSANPDSTSKRGKKNVNVDDEDDPQSTPLNMKVPGQRMKRSAYSSSGSGSPYQQAKVRNPYGARFGGMRVGA